MRFILFPRHEVEILDNWRVGGLRGTGSHDFRVHDVFAPEAHGVPAFARSGALPRTLYQTPIISLFTVALAAVTLGIARSAIDALIELAAAKTPMGSTVPLREKPIAQMQVARAEALLRGARAFLFEAIGELWDEVASGHPPSIAKRTGIRLACTLAGESCATAVDLVHKTAGGSAIQESGRIERCFRDVHAATQHIGLATGNYELAGRALLGLDVGTPRF
jgi:indole-3-acetate monooxygenase